MNRSGIRILSLTGVLLLLASFVIGQSSKVTDADMRAVLEKARNARKAIPYRLTKSTFGFPKDYSNLELMRTSVTEYSPPDRFLLVEEYKGTSGQTVKTEVLWIGKTKYLRNGKGAWEADIPEGFVSRVGTVSPVVTALDTTSEESHKYLGRQDLNGTPHEVYESIILLKFHTRPKSAVQVTKKMSWFNEQGLLVKEISEQGIRGMRKLVGRTVSVYEYDQPIKIELPIK